GSAPLMGSVPATVDAVFARGTFLPADFELIPPPAPKKLTLGQLQGAAQHPPLLELPPVAENIAPEDEDTSWRDLVFAEATLWSNDPLPQSDTMPEQTPVVVAA
ncbi:MAG: hypothetical protein SNJ82_05895, partial [Gemmataceae bacterium]